MFADCIIVFLCSVIVFDLARNTRWSDEVFLSRIIMLSVLVSHNQSVHAIMSIAISVDDVFCQFAS